MAIREILRNEPKAHSHPILSRFLQWVRPLEAHITNLGGTVTRRSLPAPMYHWLKAKWRSKAYDPPTGWVSFGNLRRTAPINRHWGWERGQPVDRYYIEQFLFHHAHDVRGRVLEVGDDSYTRRFGSEQIHTVDVLHVTEGNPKATFIGDLANNADHIPSDVFDCVILTQTLQLIYDVPAALKTLHRILKPGGVLLATVPGISQIGDKEWGEYWCWSFTPLSVRRLFEDTFRVADVKAESRGNVLAAIAFLHGLASQELREDELDYNDPAYPVTITVRAVKYANPSMTILGISRD
jgi:Methyltransferase domain